LIGFSKAQVLVNRTINIMIKDIVICVLLTFLLLTSTLLNVDRSRSLYILSWVENGKIKVVNNEYDFSRIQSKEVLDGEGIKQRIREQESRGILLNHGDSLSLSFSGTVIYKISRKMAEFFSLNGWYNNSN
jgi:hypothetical protein